MKKRLILIAAVPLIIALTVAVFAMLPPSPGVTKANFDRIHEGMTLDEVREILGNDSVIVPTGHMFSGNTAARERFQQELRLITTHSWRSDDGAYAEIEFRNDVAKNKKLWIDSTETMWQKIRRWLHLP